MYASISHLSSQRSHTIPRPLETFYISRVSCDRQISMVVRTFGSNYKLADLSIEITSFDDLETTHSTLILFALSIDWTISVNVIIFPGFLPYPLSTFYGNLNVCINI